MEFFLKKVFEGKSDDEKVHIQFMKFSRGDFKNKAVVKMNNSKGKYSISTTPEFANEFVRIVAEKIGDKMTKVMGIVVSTRDLTGELDFKDKKQFMGVKQYVLEKEMSGKEIISLCDKFPYSFIGLSFSSEDTILKIKPKAPKSAKPSTKGEEAPKADFCKIITTDRNIVRQVLFEKEIDIESFKLIGINHEFIINDIILPKGEKDFAKMRELAKRKGKIIRVLNIDGREVRKEADFIA